MKFLPPEEEIRAQLRELTSQTRRLRADLQGMIKRRGPSDKSFSHDQRYRLKPERGAADDGQKPTEAEPNDHRSPAPKGAPRSTARKRR
jgi:hypothetical protein